MPYDTDQLIEEAISLISQDICSARRDLGISSARAAKRAGVSWNRYRDIETGQVRRSRRSVQKMVEAAKRLGLESVRMCYVDTTGQYVRVDVARNEPDTVFVDALDSPLGELKAQGHFIGPHLVMDFFDREGGKPVIDSRKPVDKMMVELWATAIYALSLSDDYEYYVRPTSDDPPDTELLIVDRDSNTMEVRMVEITQYGRYSAELTDVIGKKLRKRYEKGTVLLVFVERTYDIHVVDLYNFVQEHNSHGQEIVIIGGGDKAGTFKVVPWVEATMRAPDNVVGYGVIVDTNENSKARCRFDGIAFEPPVTSRFRLKVPVYIKSVALHR